MSVRSAWSLHIPISEHVYSRNILSISFSRAFLTRNYVCPEIDSHLKHILPITSKQYLIFFIFYYIENTIKRFEVWVAFETPLGQIFYDVRNNLSIQNY